MKIFSSLRIPVTVLTIGFCWAALSNPLITFFFRRMSLIQQDVYRSSNDMVFVLIISLVLYLKIRKQRNKLVKSEEEYGQLFEANPNPLWIYNERTLRIVNVNKAAIEKYGYTRRRFLRLTVPAVCLPGDYDKLMSGAKADEKTKGISGVWKQRKSKGEVFDVSVISYPVLFNKEQCCLVMATDITELLEKEKRLADAHQKIMVANKTLLQIAWSNSHELRRPLCSIMSLVSLLKQATDTHEQQEFMELLEVSSTELDGILRHNNEMATEVELQEAI